MTQQVSVNVAAIERELSQLWQEAAVPVKGKHVVTRALTMTLVAYAPNEVERERMAAVIQELTASHPHRALLISADEAAAEPQLAAWVQANCLLTAPGVPQVCGEQITIAASGLATAQVASLVLPLLVPDLPVVAWWAGSAPFAHPIFARLRTLIDRLIVDSAAFSAQRADLIRMAELVAQPGAFTISDINWTRLTAWRELVAQFFDARPLLPHLRRLDRVEIAYSAAEGNPANHLSALLMASWLASSLGWRPLDESASLETSPSGAPTIRLHLRRPALVGGPGAIRLVTVVLRPETAPPDPLVPLALLRLEALDGVLANFSIEQRAELGCVQTNATVGSDHQIARIAHLEAQSQTELLASELRLLGRDPTFAATFALAAHFAQALGDQ